MAWHDELPDDIERRSEDAAGRPHVLLDLVPHTAAHQ